MIRSQADLLPVPTECRSILEFPGDSPGAEFVPDHPSDKLNIQAGGIALVDEREQTRQA